MPTYDLTIIGGGPAGYLAAERAARGGLSVLLFEKRELGGVCLNEGCIPTKTLLHSAKLYEQAKNGGAFGVSGENFPAVDYCAHPASGEFLMFSDFFRIYLFAAIAVIFLY